MSRRLRRMGRIPSASIFRRWSASRRGYTRGLQEGDAELRFPDASFDAVAINFGVLHLARPDAALAEAHRCSSRRTLRVYCVGEARAVRGLRHRAWRDRTARPHGCAAAEGPPFFRFSDPDEAARSLMAAGFVDAARRTIPLVWRFVPPTPVRRVRQGAVRTAALLKRKRRRRWPISTAIAEESETYRRGDPSNCRWPRCCRPCSARP